MKSHHVLIGVGLLIPVAFMLAAHTGSLPGFAEPAQIKQALLGYGAWSYLAFILAFTLLQPLGVSGMIFLLAAPLVWPWPVAFAVSMAGTLGASALGFSFARFVARDWVSARIPARLRAYDEVLARRGFVTVASLRLVFWMPPWLHAFFGVSKVRFWTHFWGSALGYTLPLLSTAYFGEKLLPAVIKALRDVSFSMWVGLGAGLLALALVAWCVSRRSKAAAR